MTSKALGLSLAAALAAGPIASAAVYAGDAATASPKDAGVRYGQALGALEVCYGSKLTDKGKALEGQFSGADLEAFKAAAAKVFDAWVKVRGCTNQRNPNICKIMMDKSCLAAEAEIGANGTAMPGLVEFAPAPKAP